MTPKRRVLLSLEIKLKKSIEEHAILTLTLAQQGSTMVPVL